MEIIIGRTGKLIVILLLIMLLPKKIFAKSAAVKNSEYTVSWDFQDQFFSDYDINEKWEGEKTFNFDETYRLFNKNPTTSTQIKIYDGKTLLSYDITSLRDISPIYNKMTSKLMFHKTDNGIDMLIYNGLDEGIHNQFAKASVISFNFSSKTVTLNKTINISFLIADYLNEYGYKNFLKNIYMGYFSENKSFPNFSFNQRGDDTCGKRNLTPTVIENNILKSDLTQDSKILKKANQMIGKAPDKILSDKEIIFDNDLKITNFEITSKSFLKEGSTNYTASNLKSFSDIPWVPSIDYKEEILTIKSDEKIGAISICNGFFKTGRADLYTKNSRVKEIEIIYPESYGITHRVFINDTGYTQFIPLINNDCKEIQIKIISVYNGSAYSDLCINCIYPIKQYDAKYYYDTFCGK